MDDETEAGLLNISISDSEDETSASTDKQAAVEEAPVSRADKITQSEADFQAVKSGYHVKVENGELWKNVSFPLDEVVPKMDAQEILHAVEELYFFRRYEEAVQFTQKILRDLDEGTKKIDKEVLTLLRLYEQKCITKAAQQSKAITP